MDYKRYGKNEDLYRAKATPEEPILKVVMEGEYEGRHFVIGAHHGGFPDAYLEVKSTDCLMIESERDEYYDGGLSMVHGGSSYFGRAYWDPEDDKTYVGWDYSHLGDYCARWPKLEGKKVTLVDILMDVAVAVTEIAFLNGDDPDYYERLMQARKEKQ